MGYLPASVIEQAGQYLLRVLQTNNKVAYSFFYDGSYERQEQLYEAAGLEIWYCPEAVVNEATHQLSAMGYVNISPLDSKLADGEPDYQIELTASGRAKVESGFKPEFEGATYEILSRWDIKPAPSIAMSNQSSPRTAGSLDLKRHVLEGDHVLFSGKLPAELQLTSSQFTSLWNEHPHEYHEVVIYGRSVKTPRWQQAYGKDYHYTGRTNAALPLLPELSRILAWFHKSLDLRLNGVLVNWYDGELGHYIGRHRDSRKNLSAGAPIVTISCGERRTFRIRPWKGRGYRDFPAADGTVFIMPYATNRAYTHEVLHCATAIGRRISITLRAFSQ